MPELTWDGKYDSKGKRVAPIRVGLPFQTVETVNESAQQRQQTLDFFAAPCAAERLGCPASARRGSWGSDRVMQVCAVFDLALLILVVGCC